MPAQDATAEALHRPTVWNPTPQAVSVRPPTTSAHAQQSAFTQAAQLAYGDPAHLALLQQWYAYYSQHRGAPAVSGLDHAALDTAAGVLRPDVASMLRPLDPPGDRQTPQLPPGQAPGEAAVPPVQDGAMPLGSMPGAGPAQEFNRASEAPAGSEQIPLPVVGVKRDRIEGEGRSPKPPPAMSPVPKRSKDPDALGDELTDPGPDSGGAQPADGQPAKSAREKNRQAQRRFRERQKTMIQELQGREHGLAQTVEELKQYIAGLEKENAVLKGLLSGQQPRGPPMGEQSLHQLVHPMAHKPQPREEPRQAQA